MPTLNWLTRDEDIKAAGRVPYRLLEADPSLSMGDPASGNMLVQADNLEALKSLLPYYAGQVKCIYIDPPYNTRSAFEHYDDNLEHSHWLAMMWPRLELLRELLAEDGSIWLSIDDHEGHYLKIILDEVFGRRNFVSNVVWQKKFSPQNDARWISDSHDHILCFAKNKEVWSPNLLPRSASMDERYTNPDKDPNGPWASTDITRAEHRDRDFWPLRTPAGNEVYPARGRSWSRPKENIETLKEQGRLWFGPHGNRMPRLKKYLRDMGGLTPQTVWLHSEVGHNQEAKREVLALGSGTVFDTPKPERLINRIIHISTNAGDLVLDSFLGSGTTAAVAHKMRRRWIGIEMGKHAVTHCGPRLRKVIEGEQGGISEAVGWRGGGGFSFYRLGEAVFDADGRTEAGIGFANLAAHVWFSETGVALHEPATSPYLGQHGERGYALLYNGVLGDRRPQGGNVLTNATLALVREAGGGNGAPLTIYGEASRLSEARLRAEGIIFKQTPYDVKAR
jgi:adenine-specific DNA-methyltransferase